MDETLKDEAWNEDVRAAPGSSLGVHLLAGLPTEAVRAGFERMGDVMPILPLDGLAGASLGEARRIGILLPPFVEPSLVVESWTQADFLTFRFGRPAHIAGVSTFVDVERVVDHMASSASLSSRGWGRGDFDRRSVADIVVGQIESATHLVLAGEAPVSESLARCFEVLNPGAFRVPFRDGSLPGLRRLTAALDERDRRLEDPGGVPGRWPAVGHRVSDAPARPAAVVPPWLEVLRGEDETLPASGLFVYRRARPFDLARLGSWLADPPKGLLRGKGRVWLANEPEQSFGYSCAGSVHRLFPAGRWWASCGEGAWPSCETDRRRLLERWHPRFGDRRQELVFAGIDLDPDLLSAGLDACLLSEAAIDDSLGASREEGLHPPSASRSRVH